MEIENAIPDSTNPVQAFTVSALDSRFWS